MNEAATNVLSDTDVDVENPVFGRYVLHREIAHGGMATIHIARLKGDEGFSRIVIVKRLLPSFAQDTHFVAMFLDEARIASKCNHRNVVPVLDVVTTGDEVVLVQEYVHGAPLHVLLNKVRAAGDRVPVPIAVAIACHVLAGLHAAHEMVDEVGMPLEVVHRDVSPSNVMIATDGTARLLDFGVAKASMAAHTTRDGTFKGKLAYSSPEQLRGKAVRQSDIYSLSVLLWELLVGHRMHGPQPETQLIMTVMKGAIPTVTDALNAEHEWNAIDERSWQQVQRLDAVVARGLAVDLGVRWRTAAEMEEALVGNLRPATASELAAWLKKYGKEYLDKHERMIALEEASWRRQQQISTNVRQPSSEEHVPMLAEGSQSAPHALVRPRSYLILALLTMFVGALAVVLILRAVRDPDAKLAASPIRVTRPAAVVPIAPRANTPPRVEPAAKPVEEPPVHVPPPSAIVSAMPETPHDPAPAKAAPARPRPAIVRAPPRPAKKLEKRPAVKSASCTPPYYYEGTKKIFKPACL